MADPINALTAFVSEAFLSAITNLRLPKQSRFSIRGLVWSLVGTVPAWLFFLAVLSLRPRDYPSLITGFAYLAIALTVGVSLQPTFRAEYSHTDAAVAGLVGAGALVSILGNTGFELVNTPTLIGIFICVGVAFQQLARVGASAGPSPSADKRLAEAKKTVETIPTDKSELQQAHAEIGSQGIAEGFRLYGRENEIASRSLLLIAVVFLMGSTVAGVWLLDRLSPDASILASLARISISLTGAVAFGVFVREAASRRRYAAWGGLIAIQAQHIQEFVADLPQEQASKVKLEFAQAVFRGGDVALDQRAARQSPSATDDNNPQITAAVDLTKQAVETVHSAVSSGSKSTK